MKLDALNNLAGSAENTAQMPVLFLGHGSPMNAIEENEFVSGFREIGKTLPKPKAILCVSAHWETRGTLVTAMEKPTTIHDFGGFPLNFMRCNILPREVLNWQQKLKKSSPKLRSGSTRNGDSTMVAGAL